MLRYVPNILTIFRLFLAMPMWYLLSQQTVESVLVGAVVFCVAVASDFLDGYLSRRFGLSSSFGVIMDPIADKVLVLTALWFFQTLSLLSWGIIGLVTAREVLVTVLRLVALKKGRILAAEKRGKLKTAVQMSSIIFLFAANVAILMQQNSAILYALFTPALVLFFWSAYLSILSGYEFFLGYFRPIRLTKSEK